MQAVSEVIRFLSERTGPGSVKAWNYALAPTVIRICIFEHLELTHLCCLESGIWYETQYGKLGDDMECIRDEQRPLIEQVEDLNVFFLSKYHEIELGLPEFLLDYWSVEIKKDPRLEDEGKKLEYEKEIERIRSVGVILEESCT